MYMQEIDNLLSISISYCMNKAMKNMQQIQDLITCSLSSLCPQKCTVSKERQRV